MKWGFAMGKGEGGEQASRGSELRAGAAAEGEAAAVFSGSGRTPIGG
jgi:hypothetical protein